MSALLFRPEGDEAAAQFGGHMAAEEVRSLQVGDRFDILCTGSIHYVAKVLELGPDLAGKLHFVKWGNRFDWEGKFDTLYMAAEGKHSAGTLNALNQYIGPVKEEDGRAKRAKKPNPRYDSVDAVTSTSTSTVASGGRESRTLRKDKEKESFEQSQNYSQSDLWPAYRAASKRRRSADPTDEDQHAAEPVKAARTGMDKPTVGVHGSGSGSGSGSGTSGLIIRIGTKGINGTIGSVSGVIGSGANGINAVSETGGDGGINGSGNSGIKGVNGSSGVTGVDGSSTTNGASLVAAPASSSDGAQVLCPPPTEVEGVGVAGTAETGVQGEPPSPTSTPNPTSTHRLLAGLGLGVDALWGAEQGEQAEQGGLGGLGAESRESADASVVSQSSVDMHVDTSGEHETGKVVGAGIGGKGGIGVGGAGVGWAEAGAEGSDRAAEEFMSQVLKVRVEGGSRASSEGQGGNAAWQAAYRSMLAKSPHALERNVATVAAWVAQHQDLFSGRVYGPVGMYCEVQTHLQVIAPLYKAMRRKKRRNQAQFPYGFTSPSLETGFAAILEHVIPRRVLLSFLVEEEADVGLIAKQLIDPSLAVCAAPKTHFRKLSFVENVPSFCGGALLDTLHCPPLVRRWLVDSCHLHCIPWTYGYDISPWGRMQQACYIAFKQTEATVVAEGYAYERAEGGLTLRRLDLDHMGSANAKDTTTILRTITHPIIPDFAGITGAADPTYPIDPVEPKDPIEPADAINSVNSTNPEESDSQPTNSIEPDDQPVHRVTPSSSGSGDGGGNGGDEGKDGMDEGKDEAPAEGLETNKDESKDEDKEGKDGGTIDKDGEDDESADMHSTDSADRWDEVEKVGDGIDVSKGISEQSGNGTSGISSNNGSSRSNGISGESGSSGQSDSIGHSGSAISSERLLFTSVEQGAVTGREARGNVVFGIVLPPSGSAGAAVGLGVPLKAAAAAGTWGAVSVVAAGVGAGAGVKAGAVTFASSGFEDDYWDSSGVYGATLTADAGDDSMGVGIGGMEGLGDDLDWDNIDVVPVEVEEEIEWDSVDVVPVDVLPRLSFTSRAPFRAPNAPAYPTYNAPVAPTVPLPPPVTTVQAFQQALSIDSILLKLRTAIGNVDTCRGPLRTSHIDPDTLRKLLSAQLALAEATNLLLS